MKRGFCDHETASLLTPAHKHRKQANSSQQYQDAQALMKTEYLAQQNSALMAENRDLKNSLTAKDGRDAFSDAGQSSEQRRRVYAMSSQQPMQQQPLNRSVPVFQHQFEVLTEHLFQQATEPKCPAAEYAFKTGDPSPAARRRQCHSDTCSPAAHASHTKARHGTRRINGKACPGETTASVSSSKCIVLHPLQTRRLFNPSP
jgi:hypothetical protein